MNTFIIQKAYYLSILLFFTSKISMNATVIMEVVNMTVSILKEAITVLVTQGIHSIRIIIIVLVRIYTNQNVIM